MAKKGLPKQIMEFLREQDTPVTTRMVASVVLVAFIGMNVFAFLGKRMKMSPRAVRSILRAL